MAFPLESSKKTKNNTYIRLFKLPSKLFFRSALIAILVLLIFFTFHGTHYLRAPHSHIHHRLLSTSATSSSSSSSSSSWKHHLVKTSAPTRKNGLTVLVTGASGFVGSHCSLALKKRGDGVVGLDNFNSYYDPSLKRDRQSLLKAHNILVIEADINDSHLVAGLFHLVTFTHVLHLAAQAGVRYAMENPQSYVRSNIAGLVTLLEAAKSAPKQPAIVWASSSSVYGLNTENPFSESHRTDRPASLYAATKKAGEAIAHSYNHIYGLSITGLRFFTVYGPWGRPDMAYFFFTKAILEGKEVKVYQTPDGKEVARDFTYIDDVVRGCLGAIDTAKESTGRKGKKTDPAQFRTYNLGNTAPVTVGKLVSILENALKVKAKMRVVKMPTNGDVAYTHANVSLALRDFGYKPTTDLGAGVRKFLKWYVRYYGIKLRSNGESENWNKW